MFRKLFNKKNDSRGSIASTPTTKYAESNPHVVGAALAAHSKLSPIEETVRARLAEPVFSPMSSASIPPMVAVLGAKGGTGATSIAVNLAATLAVTGKKTTLVDANLQQPDAAQLMGIEPEHSLMEMLNRMPFPDRQLYDACCASGPINAGGGTRADKSRPYSGAPTLLSPPLDGEAALKANLTQLAECLKLIRCYADFWVIDLPNHLDKHLITLTDMCDKILLVFEPTVTGVAACRRWLNIFADLGYDRQRIICVLNRAGAKYTAVEQQLRDCFADEPIFRLPNASAAAWDGSTRGVPLVVAHPKHIYAQAMLKLAETVSSDESASNGRVQPAPTTNAVDTDNNVVGVDCIDPRTWPLISEQMR